MKNPLYQKIFFTETYIECSTLTYNKFILNLLEHYELEKITFTLNQINVFKSNWKTKMMIQIHKIN